MRGGKMSKQIDIFGNEVENVHKHSTVDKQKRNWERAFQKWSDKNQTESSDIYGKCGCGTICDYCDDNTYGRPCVRALNQMCREKRIRIDYSKREFENIWNGIFD